MAGLYNATLPPPSSMHAARLYLALIFLAAGLVCSGRSAIGADGLEGMEPIAQIKAAIPPVSPPRSVRVAGTVTSAEKTWGNRIYLQDESAGILVFSDQLLDVSEGEKLAVEGEVHRGEFSPVIHVRSWQRLGFAELPAAKPASIDEIQNGALDGDRVEIEGWVRTAWKINEHLLGVDLSAGAGRISARVSHAAEMMPENLIAAKLRFSGVASACRTDEGDRRLVEVRVMAASPADVRVLTPPQPASATAIPVRDVLAYRPNVSPGARIKVRGAILARDDQFTFLHDGERGIAIRPVGAMRFAPGDLVEATGFPQLERSLPVLADALVTKVEGRAPVLVPARIVNDLRRVEYHGRYVSLEGELMDRMIEPAPAGAENGRMLLLAVRSAGGVIAAECRFSSGSGVIAGLEPGAMVELSGAAEVSTDVAGRPVSSKLLLPTLESIRVITKAPYLNARRLMIAAWILISVLLAGALRVAILSRRAARLAQRNASLEADIRERRAVTSERLRLAEDLHDHLQQTLTGIDLHLETIVREGRGESAAAASSAKAARLLLGKCHHDLRRTVWNLHDAAEAQRLSEMLQAAVADASVAGAVHFLFDVVGEEPELAGKIKEDLLSVVREALMNVVKHSGASKAEVRLVMNGCLEIEIADDGCGFVPAHARSPEAGHFGLKHMAERMQRIGGDFKVDSAPGKGCRVRGRMPLELLAAAVRT